ncbi:hypothetical protein D3C87_1604060 [compost metagenome]
MLAAELRAQGVGQQGGKLRIVGWRQAHLGLLREQSLQHGALADRDVQPGDFFRQTRRLMNPKIGVGAVGHQNHYPTHAARDQRIAGRGGQVHGVGEATRFDQQLGALAAPLRQVFGSRRRCR